LFALHRCGIRFPSFTGTVQPRVIHRFSPFERQGERHIAQALGHEHERKHSGRIQLPESPLQLFSTENAQEKLNRKYIRKML
jgi:hypothetical protein